jgi:DNA polymerase-4
MNTPLPQPDSFEEVFGWPEHLLGTNDSKGAKGLSADKPSDLSPTSPSSHPEQGSTHIRRIAHLDMDAFYASVELLRYPQLRDLPVVIGGGKRSLSAQLKGQDPKDWNELTPLSDFPRLRDYAGRGVITTATYAARRFGVGSAMGLMKAAQLCPDAYLLPVDFEQYRHYSKLFKSVILDICPVMQNTGVDEVYLDFTHVPGGQRENGLSMAKLIQRSIFQATGLTCSIGVAPNKLLAKMASEFNKPNGISILLESDLESRIWPLACRKVNGIGPKANDKLSALGILTIGDLAQRSLDELVSGFGKKYGAWLYAVARGQDDRPLETHSEPVSLSRETTFERNMLASKDRAELGEIFTRLCTQVSLDLQNKKVMGKTVGVKIKFDNFKIITRDLTLDHPVDQALEIRQAASQCLKRIDWSRRFRLMGVRISSLVPKAQVNFDGPHTKGSATGTPPPLQQTSLLDDPLDVGHEPSKP